MAAEGAKVVVNDLGVNVDGTGAASGPADEVVEAIRKAGGSAAANHDNVADHDAAEQIIRQALNEFGRLDILVNVAGILRDRMVFNMAEEEWDAVIAVHLKGTFNTTKFASIYWRQAREGHYRLINFTSGSGLHGAPGQPNYAAAKLGIVGFTYSCANALGRYGVTANCIAPGAATRMVAAIPEERARGMGVRQAGDEMSPDNVAPAVVYLASEQSDWLSGRVIGAAGYRISLYSNPEVIREIQSTGPWSLDDAFKHMERSFKPAVLGRTMFGQAPAGQGQPQQAEPAASRE
jgi:NAD(P)-dependent dehydrogenase (short-subunit alcohol dehydrogenase family)